MVNDWIIISKSRRDVGLPGLLGLGLPVFAAAVAADVTTGAVCDLNLLSLDTLAQLGGHARIHLDDGGLLGLFQDADRKVTGTGTNLEHHVCWLEVGLVDDALRDKRVLENVLAELVRVEDGILGGSARVLVRGVRGVRVGGSGTSRAWAQARSRLMLAR